jgi:hypothetical protein
MKKCVDSWEKFCPDYEIVEWNEDNYDVNQNSFIREAYKAKKWAFVSDFARMDVVYRYGGIYMDTDVELIKPMDRFLNDAAFCGMEAASVPALSLPFGAAAGNELIGGLRDLYKRIPFLKANGEYNLTPCTHYHAMMFRGLGLTKENRIQHVKGFSVYPTDVFSPAHPALVYECFTGNTHAIHHYAASWRADAENEDKLDVAARYREIMDGMHKGNLYKVPISR